MGPILSLITSPTNRNFLLWKLSIRNLSELLYVQMKSRGERLLNCIGHTNMSAQKALNSFQIEFILIASSDKLSMSKHLITINH